MSGSDAQAPARERPDLRLLPLAGGLWAGLGAVLLGQPSARLVILAVVMVALLGCMVGLRRCARAGPWRGARAGLRPRFAPCPPVPGSHRSRVAAVAAVGTCLGLLLGAMHLSRLHPGVIRGIVTESAVVVAEAVVTGDPMVHWPADDGGRAEEPRWSASARVTRLTARGVTHALAVPVVLRGDAVRALRYGSRVQVTGRASPAWAPERSAFVLSVLGPVRVRAPPGAVARGTTALREGFRRATTGLPTDAAALLLGLAVGDESMVGPELDRAMIRSGLAHLTAVSGSNTALVVGLALGLAAALGWGWRSRVGWSVLVLAGYVALVRPQPSVLRAAAMGLVALLALSTGGRRRGPPALLAAVLALLVAWPEFALSLGFALSTAATAGLLLAGPPIAERLARWPVSRRVPDPIRAALSVAAAAHLATLPLAVLMGNGASLVALPANVVVTPLVPVATVLGLAAALLAPVSASVAGALAHLASPATAFIAWVAHRASALPGGVVAIPGGPAPALLVGAALALGVVGAHRRWRPWRSRGAWLAAGLVLAVVGAVRSEADRRWPPPGWVVLACDVGQGDGLLLRRPGATEALVVDVGPVGDAMARCVRDAGVRPAAVLLTHFHADHVDGLASVLELGGVGHVLATPVAEPADTAWRATEVVHGSGAVLHQVRAGDLLRIAGLEVHVLWPARRIAESPANNSSVVARVDLPTASGGLGVLLTGDVEPEAQAALMGRDPGPADVVKVPHHGSRHQLAGFAAWTGARIALVSVGADNDYGHPSQETLADYRLAGMLVGRTDAQGALAVVDAPAGPALVVQR